MRRYQLVELSKNDSFHHNRTQYEGQVFTIDPTGFATNIRGGDALYFLPSAKFKDLTDNEVKTKRQITTEIKQRL